MPGTSPGMTTVFVARIRPNTPAMSPSPTNNIAIIGAGPAGLMAAEVLAQGGADVTVYDAMPSAGRKFLMAGRGGLNLTHSEPLPAFLARYREAMPHLAAAIEAFPPQRSARLERGAGAADLCRLQRPGFSKSVQGLAAAAGMAAAAGFDGRAIGAASSLDRLGRAWPSQFQTPDGPRVIDASATVLALGGASWPRLGLRWRMGGNARRQGRDDIAAATGQFRLHRRLVRHFSRSLRGPAAQGRGADVRCAQRARRSRRHPHRHRGRRGLCAVGRFARGHPAVRGRRRCTSRCGPISTIEGTDREGCRRRKANSRCRTSCARRCSLSPVAIGLLQEAAKASGASLASLPPTELAGLINAVPIELTGVAPIARAISTAGGIAFDELDADFMIRRLPGVFAAGEMLDWEAPTGGYLLQASFATGAAAGRGALKWLVRDRRVGKAKRAHHASHRVDDGGHRGAHRARIRTDCDGITATSPVPPPAACR